MDPASALDRTKCGSVSPTTDVYAMMVTFDRGEVVAMQSQKGNVLLWTESLRGSTLDSPSKQMLSPVA